MFDSASLQVFFSNQLEVLYQQLKQNLFAATTPFAKRLIIVQGPAMKEWVMMRMAQDPMLDIAMGIEFIYMSQAFDYLLRFTHSHSFYFPTGLELNLMIEKELMDVLHHFKQLSSLEQQDWLPLFHYLKLNPAKELPKRLSPRIERRLIGFSHHLTQLFQEYGRYAKDLFIRWNTTPDEGWQARLWEKLFNRQTQWSCLAQVLQLPFQSCHFSGEVHFFSISFLTANEFKFLTRLSAYLPLYYYSISPCAVFWSDIRSDKETAYLQKFWQQKWNISSSRLLNLEELLRDRNPLLANFGRIGREMARQIEESLVEIQGHYFIPSAIQALDSDVFFHDDLYLFESKKPLTLLQALQADLLLLRNPQNQLVFDFEKEPCSIQLHLAVNKQREIEILYQNLLALMAKDPTLKPRDILVMAPQMTDYIPYIQSLFGAKKSQLDYQILDLGLQTQSELIQGFLHLISLIEGRWNSNQILQLFEHRSFQRRHQLTSSDYRLIQDWIKQADIRWGEDLPHRNDLLQRRHCQQGMVEETAIGTWDYGFSRLLSGLTTVLHQKLTFTLEVLPCASIDFSQGDLLGRWIRLLQSLRDDLSPLHDRTQLTMQDWINYLNCLLDNYFQPDFENSSSIEEKEELKVQFEQLRSAARFCEETVFSFQSVKTHLLSLLQQRGLTYQENHLETVRFCSFMPLRSIPARVIALVGMQEEAFPRLSQSSALNLMANDKEKDYVPNATDYDRYLFLEALHATQDYFLISYPFYHPKDGKEIQSSLVIEELFNYLENFYTIQQQKISHVCIFKHPFDAFDKKYFQAHPFLINFSQQDFNAAQVHYQINKELPFRFLTQFNHESSDLKTALPHQTQIDLKSLSAVARHPIKFHLNKVLDIYLQEEQERQYKTEEEWTLSSLNKYQLIQHALKESPEHVLYRAEREGKLPFGLFKQVATNRLREEMDEMHLRLKHHAIESQDIIQFEFCMSCTEPTQIALDHWLFPAITLSLTVDHQIMITGKLPQVTPKGLLALSKGSLSDAWKIWPTFLLYCQAIRSYPNVFSPHLVMAYASQPKIAFFEDPLPYLKQFIEYYMTCLNHFSPLLPDWIPLILEENHQELKEKMMQLFVKTWGTYQSPDLKWLLNPYHLPDAAHLIEQWKNQTELLLGTLRHFWYPEKPSKNLIDV
jgi:exodeoxyribonuclease V gamma subunit